MVREIRKPPLTFCQQLQTLKNLGLLIESDKFALAYLKAVSYYRLEAYWHPFFEIEQSNTVSDNFKAGIYFSHVTKLYEFDRNLRLLVMDAIERIEVHVRSLFSYQMGHKYGELGYTEATNFHNNFDHANWLEKLKNETVRVRKRETSISDNGNNYSENSTLPVWKVTEIMSLGSLSLGYWGLNHYDKKCISMEFNLHHKCLTEWLHTLTYIRNICSHHGRLWNKKLAIKSSTMRDEKWKPPITPRQDRIFYILLILRYLLLESHIGNEWKNKVEILFGPIVKEERWHEALGVPADWKNHPVWR